MFENYGKATKIINVGCVRRLHFWTLLFVCFSGKHEDKVGVMEKLDDGTSYINDASNGIIYDEETEVQHEPETTRKCHGLRTFCHKTCLPCRTKYNQLPQNASCFDRFKFAFLCPPHDVLARYLQFLVLCGITYAVLISLFKDYALPGGNFFSLYVLFFGSVLGGYLISFIKLPPLLGKFFFKSTEATEQSVL